MRYDFLRSAGSKVVITSDEAMRGGKVIPLKTIVDDALKGSPSVEKVFVVARTDADIPRYRRDIMLKEVRVIVMRGPTGCILFLSLQGIGGGVHWVPSPTRGQRGPSLHDPHLWEHRESQRHHSCHSRLSALCLNHVPGRRGVCQWVWSVMAQELHANTH